MPERILSTEFNLLVPYMAKGIRWETVDTEFPSFEAMRQDYLDTAVLKVYSGQSENTIYGDPRLNHAARAWHDHCHLLANADFSLEGERRAADLQVKQMEVCVGRSGYRHHLLINWFERIILAEAVGQAEYYFANNKFPDNQYEFTLDYLRKTERRTNEDESNQQLHVVVPSPSKDAPLHRV